MASINAFYRSSSASTYATQLFSGAKTPTMTGPTRENAPSTYVPGASAAEKAISRIIEILALGGGDSAETASVEESFGHITSARGTKDDDKLTLAGRTVSNVSTGAGDDTLTVKTTSASSIDGGDGADQIKLAARFINDITGGKGDDIIEMSGESVLSVSGGVGSDTIKVSATTVLGLSGGEGDDKLYLEGKRLSASGGTGNDAVTFNIKDGGSAEYAFARGDGKDTITSNGPVNVKLTGYMPSDITMSASDNRMVLTFKGSDDKITIDFAKDALRSARPDYALAMDKGSLVLKID